MLVESLGMSSISINLNEWTKMNEMRVVANTDAGTIIWILLSKHSRGSLVESLLCITVPGHGRAY